MKLSQSNVARFKRDVYKLFGVHTKVERDNELLRVSGIKVPRHPSAEFVELFGMPMNDDATWPRKLGEQYGLRYEGFDEDGNACWWVKPTDFVD